MQQYKLLEQKRIDALRPVSKRPGTEGKATGYKIRSSWQLNVAAEEGITIYHLPGGQARGFLGALRCGET